jgi:predicted DNA-binding antitoxin AbrB/MazE fold protein
VIQTEAIYEGGVLRPLSPLDLPEHGIVSLSISPVATTTAQDEVAHQRGVLLAYVESVESRDRAVPLDALTNRDHDRLIYGD